MKRTPEEAAHIAELVEIAEDAFALSKSHHNDVFHVDDCLHKNINDVCSTHKALVRGERRCCPGVRFRFWLEAESEMRGEEEKKLDLEELGVTKKRAWFKYFSHELSKARAEIESLKVSLSLAQSERDDAENEGIAEYNRLLGALRRCSFDLKFCAHCGETIICKPDGLPVCDNCYEAWEESQKRREMHGEETT